MTNAYEIVPDDARWGRNIIDAVHSRMLPGVCCPVCSGWATTGVIYPSVDMSALNDLPRPETVRAVTVKEYERLTSVIGPVLGAKRPLEPGTEFGPLRGKAKGNFGDFAWVNPWNPLIRESVWLELKEAGIILTGIRAELDFGKRVHEPLIEIEVLPTATLTKPYESEACAHCRKQSVQKPEKISVVASSLNSSEPLQRIFELPTVILANERLAQFIQRRNLKGAILSPVELS